MEHLGELNDRKGREKMKFTSKIRMQAVLVGLGAALFFANAAYAQQDMDPTTFETDPAAVQAQAAPAAQSATPEMSTAPTAVATPTAADTESVAVQQAGSKEWSPVATLMVLGTILCLAYIVMRRTEQAWHGRDSQVPA
jgi:hypothetical protein